MRLAAMMTRPGGPLAAELRDLATLTIDLLDVVTPDPDLEPYLADAMSGLEEDDADKEPSLGWSANVTQLALHSCPIDGENEPDDALAGETAMADLLPAPASFAASLTCP